jgi:hypothetical protein
MLQPIELPQGYAVKPGEQNDPVSAFFFLTAGDAYGISGKKW